MHNDPKKSRSIASGRVNSTFTEILQARMSRRQVLQGAAAFAVLGCGLPLGGCATASLRPRPVELGFQAVPVSTDDVVHVPQGYSVQVLYRWGDPIGHVSGAPQFKPDAGNSAADQALQAGMHHDGMHFYPLPYGSDNSERGLLVVNHEYVDDGLLHPDGFANWNAEKVRKSQNAHGVSVIEIQSRNGRWSVMRPSQYARRITASTPLRIAGPAAGHELLKTAADPTGTQALGTINNCASGHTPWGTYLTCEENWNDYFANVGAIAPEQRRYNITTKGKGYRWHEFDPRFDAQAHPNEPNRFGWIVEIDPFDPGSVPVKRTALGRFSHEGARLAVAHDRRIAIYSGDDARFEHIYKFVSRDPYNANDRAANSDILDHGTLHAARFNEDGTGEWVALVHGENGLTAGNGFAGQAEVLIKARVAGDTVRATRMDRPEWIAVHPETNEVYCTLTNNSDRGTRGPGRDAANPRNSNVFGHIIRWREAGGDPAATKFEWDIFVLAGDPKHADPAKRGNIRGDLFGSPDGLWFDKRGVLWIQTDVSTSVLNKGDYTNLGNNQMLAADVATGEIRRFLTGPRGCEITGITQAADGRALLINIQHPGETSRERNDPKSPHAVSSWPDGPSGGRPRSATIVIRRADNGVIGA